MICVADQGVGMGVGMCFLGITRSPERCAPTKASQTHREETRVRALCSFRLKSQFPIKLWARLPALLCQTLVLLLPVCELCLEHYLASPKFRI